MKRSKRGRNSESAARSPVWQDNKNDGRRVKDERVWGETRGRSYPLKALAATGSPIFQDSVERGICRLSCFERRSRDSGGITPQSRDQNESVIVRRTLQNDNSSMRKERYPSKTGKSNFGHCQRGNNAVIFFGDFLHGHRVCTHVHRCFFPAFNGVLTRSKQEHEVRRLLLPEIRACSLPLEGKRGG